MRKLIPVLLLTFSGSIAFAQSSSDKLSDSKENSFAESLRLEIVSGIKKKIASDTSLQKSQEMMNEFYKACGVQPTIQRIAQPEPAKSFKALPENFSAVDVNKSSVARKQTTSAAKDN
jgi:hypothetical protein